MTAPLSPYHLTKARDIYNAFNFMNSISWALLAGNIITLLAMRLQASSTYIGALNALMYASYFFLPLGKLLTKRFSIVKIYSVAWIFRSLAMAPLLLAPFFFAWGRQTLALSLTFAGVCLFHVFRGIGMISNNPVLNELAAGPDRSSYLTQIQVVYNGVAMFAGFAVALLLGRDPPVFFYSILMFAGIATGIMSALMVAKIPEPEKDQAGGRGSGGFTAALKTALREGTIRYFILIFLFLATASVISRAFLVVYIREVFKQSDGMISLYAVFGSLGALVIGLLVKFLVDRIGIKPLYVLCACLGVVGMAPILFVPASLGEQIPQVILFLTFLSFLVNFAFLGAEGISQTYFLALVPQEFMLDMGILYFFAFGIAGTGGSFLAGLFLDAAGGLGLSSLASYRILYALLIIIVFAALALQRKLAPLGSLPLRGAMEVIFSPRDLRAIALLDRLKKTEGAEEEEELLEALHDTPSQLAIAGLLERARAPRLSVRLEALRAIEALPALNEDAERALMEDLIRNPYTTAYISARILGNHDAVAAIPVLRELAGSDDYMLAGEAIIALAKMGDQAFRPTIEELVARTENPRLKIMGVQAFGIYRSPNSLPVLLDILKGENPPPYLRDEVSLAMAAIVNLQNSFYPLLVRYLGDPALAGTLAQDEAEAAVEAYFAARKSWSRRHPQTVSAKQARALLPAVTALTSRGGGAPLSRWILDLEIPGRDDLVPAQVIFAEALLDDELSLSERLRLLIVHWSAGKLRAA